MPAVTCTPRKLPPSLLLPSLPLLLSLLRVRSRQCSGLIACMCRPPARHLLAVLGMMPHRNAFIAVVYEGDGVGGAVARAGSKIPRYVIQVPGCVVL